MLPLIRHTTRTVGRRRWLLPKQKIKKSQTQIQQEIDERQTKRERLILDYENQLRGVDTQQQEAVTQAFIRERPVSKKIMEDNMTTPKSTPPMSNHDWMMMSNEQYRSTFATKVGSLPIIPARHMTIITCMDARIDPGKAMGIAEGDAHIIRNAGARVKDALRSLIISQEMMGTREVAIIHHTNCGACTLNEQNLRQRLKDREQSSDASDIDFMSFNNADVFENVRNEIKIYQKYQTLIQGIPVKGYVFDVKTGTLHHVHEENVEHEISNITSQHNQQTEQTLINAIPQTEQQQQQSSSSNSSSSSTGVATAATVATIGVVASNDDEQKEASHKKSMPNSIERLVRLVSSSFS